MELTAYKTSAIAEGDQSKKRKLEATVLRDQMLKQFPVTTYKIAYNKKKVSPLCK